MEFHLLFLPTPIFVLLFALRDMSILPKGRWLDRALLGFALTLAAYQLWRTFLQGA